MYGPPTRVSVVSTPLTRKTWSTPVASVLNWTLNEPVKETPGTETAALPLSEPATPPPVRKRLP